MASATERLRLGTGIVIAPQRNPVQTAKLAASIDYLSKGRLDLGLGVGWVREEFDALDVPFVRRGSRTDEYIDVMRALWEEDPSTYEGVDYRLPPSRHFPKPVQQPLPVHIGGNSDAALARVAARGQGWYAFNLDPEGLCTRLEVLEKELQQRGRARDAIQVSVCGYRTPVDADVLERYRDAGADRVILFAMDLVPGQIEPGLDRYAALGARR